MKPTLGPWKVFGALGGFVLLMTTLLAGLMFAVEAQQFNGTMRLSETQMLGRDFVNIWHGGRLATEDAPGVYDRDSYRAALKAAVDITGIYAFSYPPHMLMASIPFGQLPYWAAYLAWTVLTMGLFWHASRPFLASVGLPSWSMLVLPAFWVNLWAGHFGFLIGALALYGWHFARARPALSGLAFAAMTVKPHLGVLVPFVLAAKHAWRTILWAGAGTVALVIMSGFALGWKSWAVWLQSTLPFQASLLDTPDQKQFYLTMMPTVERFNASLGVTGPMEIVVSLVFAAAAIALMVKAWRKRLAFTDLGLLSIIATFLLLPYVFIYDMVAFNLAILVLAARVRDQLGGLDRVILALAFLLPLYQLFIALLFRVQIGPILILASLWILVRHLTTAQDAPA